MPTHAHNKAPTADHWVAGGGFSLDDAQRENPSRGNTHYYIGQSERSARPFVRQRPEGTAFVDARQFVGRHSAQGLRQRRRGHRPWRKG
ncbi:MAG: hypothetical protein HXL28_08210 [Prevotellaceae bacterium]|nr:hypothetical protein [Prevotellaceae bacterium]